MSANWSATTRAEVRRRLSNGENATRISEAMSLRACTVRAERRSMVASGELSEFALLHGSSREKTGGEFFEVPDGHVVKGVSALVDMEGREVLKWVKTREDSLAPADLVAAFKDALSEMAERASASKPPDRSDDDLVTIYPAADWHLGLLTWKRETGQNWDLDIAQETIITAINRLVDISPRSRQAVILGLGDLLHADGYDNSTPKSKNVLDVDGRYPKILKTAVKVMITKINLALIKHDRVLVRILPGNHDPESAIAVALALSTYYTDEPRVEVDDDPSYFWFWSWGATLLGATHGDAAKMKDLPIIMATWNPEAWGRSKYRHIYTGHIHTQTGVEVSGVTVESFQTPAPGDAWHTRMGYRGNRSISAITIHKEDGEIARNKVNIV